jgi:hypothetical protein
MRIMSKSVTFGLGAALLLAAAPASAITTFANFSPTTSSPNISFDGSLSGAGTITSVASPVNFSFLDADGITPAITFSSLMNLTATTGDANLAYGLAILPISAGTLTFTSTSAVTYNGHTGTNLLTVAFSGGSLTGLMGGSTASYGNSTPPNTVTFTSDFLDFSSTTARDLVLGINGINPSLGFAFGGSRSHSGVATGNFGADLSAGSPQGDVPEPASWALMLVGFGMAGGVMRSQRRRVELTFG